MISSPPIDWPSDWNIAQINDLEPKPELALEIDDALDGKGRKTVEGCITFHYGDMKVDAFTRGATLFDADARRQIRRQVDVERRFVQRLYELGMQPNSYGEALKISQAKIPTLVCVLLAEGWTVLGNDRLFRTGGEFNIEATTGLDWFDLDGYVDFENEIATLRNQRALGRGRSLVDRRPQSRHRPLKCSTSVEGRSVNSPETPSWTKRSARRGSLTV